MNGPPLFLLSTPPWSVLIGEFASRALRTFAVPGLIPTSWYRDPFQNAAAGGSDESQHLFALGLDLDGPEQSLRRARDLARQLGLTAVLEADHLHLQLFPPGMLARFGVVFPRVPDPASVPVLPLRRGE